MHPHYSERLSNSYIGFSLPCIITGPERLRHPCNQSDVETNYLWLAISHFPVLEAIYVFVHLSSYWLLWQVPFLWLADFITLVLFLRLS